MMDAHVIAASKMFRDAGVTLGAMQWPRCAEGVAALRAFNGVPDNWPTPFVWRFHPNQWCADNWRQTYAKWIS